MRLHPDHPALWPTPMIEQAIAENSVDQTRAIIEIARQDQTYKQIMHRRLMDSLREHGDRIKNTTIGK